MDVGQTARKIGRGFRAALSGLKARAGETADRARAAASGGAATPGEGHRFPAWSKVAGAVVILLVLFYPLRACWVSDIDDNPAFWPSRIDAGGSAAVAVMAALIDREVNDHGWTPNSPGFTPTGMLLDDMPNYQRGIVAGLALFGPILERQIGNAGAVLDPDLGEAAAKLDYPPDVWLWDWSQGFWPTGSSGGAYLDAKDALDRYNVRLAHRQALFNRTPENLARILDAVSRDFADAADAIDAGVAGTGTEAPSATFYRTKGRVYAEYLVLEGFAKDFSAVLAGRKLMGNWNRMMSDIKLAATARSGAVRGGSPGVAPSPCDLCTEGFFILRARLKMDGIAGALRK